MQTMNQSPGDAATSPADHACETAIERLVEQDELQDMITRGAGVVPGAGARPDARCRRASAKRSRGRSGDLD